MRQLLILILIALTAKTYSQQTKKTSQLKLLHIFYYDLNNDGTTDTIMLSSSLDGDWRFEVWRFNKITIKLSGYKKQSFIAKEYWTNFDRWFIDSNKNAVKTELILVKKADKHAVILLWGGLDGAGYGNEFSIINIENNKSKMVFDPDFNPSKNHNIDIECPTKLIDLENNGRLCFIYRNIFEFYRVLKKGKVGTYSPFFVYPVDDSCKLSKPLTIAYNKKHYVFAGFRYNESIEVYYPNDGSQPRILKKRNVSQ
jgi:hypothetical protein